MRKIPTILFVGLVAVTTTASAQVRIERPITLQTTLQVQTAVVARVDSLDNYLQPAAREKLAITTATAQKQLAGTTDLSVIVQSARSEVIRQFPRMTSAQVDRMVFLALTAAATSDERDSLGELSTEKSLRLQRYQDRRAKLMETMSNMMKKMSETSDSII